MQVMRMTIEDFKKRMEHQKEIELMAWNSYTEFTGELKPGKYREMFVRIAEQELYHAQLIDEILERLQ